MKKFMLLGIIICLNSCTFFDSNKIKESVDTLKPVTTQFEYGDLYQLDTIFDNNDIEFIDKYLDVSSLGENKTNIQYKLENQIYQESFTYYVADTTKPLIWLNSSYSIELGDTEPLTDKIICADNYDKKPNCYIEGTYDPNTLGTYSLKFIAKDSNNNTEEKDFILYVKNKRQTSNSNYPKVRKDINSIIAQYKNEETMIGIDVSKYQGDIDWQKVKNAGVEFAIIRLGLGYDDIFKTDEKFTQNIENALKNNIKVGIYFYSYAITGKEAKEQAKYVIKNIKDYDISLPIAFDWENFTNWNEYEISLFDLRNISNAFLDTIQKAGYAPIQYGSKNYLKAFWSPIKYDTWLAHYIDGETDYDQDYIIWQLCNNGQVDGIQGDVDIDIYYIK